ncbi:MAG: ABC transporter ATP-binding protein [Spirochaetota bacterium]|nr:ABC transporter ATP-binding protein [Spirochaetota bacterium]
MIQVQNLVKDYGIYRALKDISFEINRGEIVGLLGHNGAGKTTLMRVITGFIHATSGLVKINNIINHEHPKKIKKIIGYLPENSPLYPEMTVKEFLIYMAQLKGIIRKNIKCRLDYVLEATKIKDKLNSIIRTLSKGYKQRVGLAQALIHDPEILILDEPSVGLDPSQIIEIRELIKTLKGERTIILSTHILPEASQTCERIIIISNGTITAQGTETELINSLSNDDKVKISLKNFNHKAINLINAIEGVNSTQLTSNDTVEVNFDKKKDPRPIIAKVLIDNNFELYSMANDKISLEEVFLRVTQDKY